MKRCSSALCLMFVLAASSFSLLTPASAASQEGAQSEFWPEVDLFYRFDAQWRLFALAGISRAREIQYTDRMFGAHVDFSFYPLPPLLSVTTTDFERFRAFQFRVGYTNSRSIGKSAGQYKEHRGVVEASVRLALTEILLFSDRNRGELRILNEAFCWRYRNRVRVERQTETDFVTFTPFLSAEFFYDSRYETWNRQLYSIGIEWTLRWGFVLETSYQRQNDSRSSPSAVNAFGLTMSLYY